jgi:hypothetical protein
MALSACIDDRTNIACFDLRALGLFAWARADDQFLRHPLTESSVLYIFLTVRQTFDTMDSLRSRGGAAIAPGGNAN